MHDALVDDQTADDADSHRRRRAMLVAFVALLTAIPLPPAPVMFVTISLGLAAATARRTAIREAAIAAAVVAATTTVRVALVESSDAGGIDNVGHAAIGGNYVIGGAIVGIALVAAFLVACRIRAARALALVALGAFTATCVVAAFGDRPARLGVEIAAGAGMLLALPFVFELIAGVVERRARS